MRRSLILSAFAFIAACDSGSKDTKPTTPESGTAATKSDALTVPAGTGPAATVNGVELSRDIFNREYAQTMERYQKARHEVRPGLKERLKDNIMRRLVDMEVIRQQAEKLDVALTTEEKDKQWANHRKRYGTQEAFVAFLERAGTTEEDIRRQFNANLLREKVFAKVASSVAVTDNEVRAFYDSNKQRYTEPEQVKARHILIRKPPNADANTVSDIKAKAAKVLKEVKKKPKDFGELAKEYSEDVTKTRGGELGWFAKGRMVKPFEEAAWSLKNGQISNLVETSFGFHVIKREDFKEGRTKPFKEVESLIRRSLTARRRNQAIQESIKTWRADAKIDVFVKGDPEIIKKDMASSKPVAPRPTIKVDKAAPVDTRTSPIKTPAPGDRTGPAKQ